MVITPSFKGRKVRLKILLLIQNSGIGVDPKPSKSTPHLVRPLTRASLYVLHTALPTRSSTSQVCSRHRELDQHKHKTVSFILESDSHFHQFFYVLELYICSSLKKSKKSVITALSSSQNHDFYAADYKKPKKLREEP